MESEDVRNARTHALARHACKLHVRTHTITQTHLERCDERGVVLRRHTRAEYVCQPSLHMIHHLRGEGRG